MEDSCFGMFLFPTSARISLCQIWSQSPVNLCFCLFFPAMMSHPPIPITELSDHIERLKGNDNFLFSQEYEVSNDETVKLNKYLGSLYQLCCCSSLLE